MTKTDNQVVEIASEAAHLWDDPPDHLQVNSPKQAVYVACEIEDAGYLYDEVLNFLLERGFSLERSQEWLSDVREILRRIGEDCSPGYIGPNDQARRRLLAKETWAIDALAQHEPESLLRDCYEGGSSVMSKVVASPQ